MRNRGVEARTLKRRFLVDWLKTKAPFWKLEDTPEGAQWVAADARDDAAAARWREDKSAP